MGCVVRGGNAIVSLLAFSTLASCGARSGSKTGCQAADAGDSVDPGAALVDPATTGKCSCASRTLGDVLGQISQANPQLSDITALAGPFYMDSAGLIFAFATPGGFRVVYKRGSGDCSSGCISNEYWYFETDAACAPALVGHYSAQFAASGSCSLVVGQPLWGFPTPRTACPDGGTD